MKRKVTQEEFDAMEFDFVKSVLQAGLGRNPQMRWTVADYECVVKSFDDLCEKYGIEVEKK